MRIRIRGPSGQSTITLDDTSTVEVLRKTIATETSLSNFDIKYGYPPKPLLLDQYEPTKPITEIEVKLNGEQLIITKSESASTKDIANRPEQAGSSGATQAKAAAQSSSQSSQSATPQKPQAIAQSSSAIVQPKKSNDDTSDPPEILLPEIGGALVLRIMPDDNSCLFRAVASAVMSGLDTMTELRSIVAQTIQSDPVKYTKAILDNKNPDVYCRWIQTEDAWGGQIELDILSRQFDIEICSIDVKSLRVDKYNEGAARRCIVVYSGIHYDTIALSMFGMQPEDDVKQFEGPLADEVLPQAIALCQKLQEQHYYTDTTEFRLRCGDCGAICVGENGATAHAKKTGHYNFGEAA